MTMTLETPATLHDEHDSSDASDANDANDQPIAGKIGGDEQTEQTEQTDQGGPDAQTGNDGRDDDGTLDASASNQPDDIAATSGPPAEPVEHDDAFWQELEIIGEIAQAERDCQNCQREYDELKSDLKDTKEELDASQIRLRRATSKLVDHIGDRELPEKPGSESATTPAGSTDQPANDDAWKAKPTAELLAGIKGLGKKKLESIIELAPNVGKLEELRGEASRQHQSFHVVLPMGCGQSIADAIEDRLIDHVAKFAPAESEVEDEQGDGDSDGEDAEPDQPSDDQLTADDPTSEAHQPADGDEYEDVE